MSSDECMICFESRTMYKLKGCSHSICVECEQSMKTEESIQHPFSHTFTVMISEQIKCIKCPYCRQMEPAHFNMNRLMQEHNDDYKFWMELELKFDGEQSVACDVETDYFLGRKRTSIHYFLALKGESFDRYFDHSTGRYRKMPMTKRDQLNEHKPKHIQTRSMKR